MNMFKDLVEKVERKYEFMGAFSNEEEPIKQKELLGAGGSCL
jgi:hypothetical protein